jgi:hypothetical protein
MDRPGLISVPLANLQIGVNYIVTYRNPGDARDKVVTGLLHSMGGNIVIKDRLGHIDSMPVAWVRKVQAFTTQLPSVLNKEISSYGGTRRNRRNKRKSRRNRK